MPLNHRPVSPWPGAHPPGHGPIEERVRRIADLGFDAEIWDWTRHDIDSLARTGAAFSSMTAVEVYAVADALARPDWKDRGLLDTSIVVVRFDNGALATAEASFQAVYGYDIRGEVFGSAGMVTAGDVRRTSATVHTEAGVASDTWRRNIDLFHDAYVAELADFVACVRERKAPRVTGTDARAALAIALAAIRSVETGAPVRIGGDTQ